MFLTLHFPAEWKVLTGSLYAAVCVKDLQSGQSDRQLHRSIVPSVKPLTVRCADHCEVVTLCISIYAQNGCLVLTTFQLFRIQ